MTKYLENVDEETEERENKGDVNTRRYHVVIRFYEELNDFLKRFPKKQDIPYDFIGRRSVKDLIESFGVPHVEVDLILVNGHSKGFDYIVQDGDRISVYPVFERFRIDSLTLLRDGSLRESRFVLDVHLGTLARYLRLLGFDVDYEKDRGDPELADISARERRILLTRDRQLLMRRIVDRGMILRNTDPFLQVVEVLERLDLWEDVQPFNRCLMCNGAIRQLVVDSEAWDQFQSEIPPGVKSWCDVYYRCEGCGRLYWSGSHYNRMVALIERIMNERS